jgi:chaperonin cofactor prefoldin
MDKAYYEIIENFSPIYKTAMALIRGREGDNIADIIESAEISVVNTDYDNWNGGTYGYTLYLNLSVKTYSLMSKDKISEYEKAISDALNEVNKGDENNTFYVQICPIFSKTDIDWSIIGGAEAKTQLKRNIETVKNIMISVSTGGARIQSEENRYKNLHSTIKKDLSQLKIEYFNPYEGLWDWYGKWSSDFNTYQERRNYINNLFASTLDFFDFCDEKYTPNDTIISLSGWERINRTVIKIKKDSEKANNEEDFQTIGLLCREVIISLAQAVYNSEIHGATDEKGISIGNTDAVRMLSNYIGITLSGGSNEELRAYARNTNKLANSLTHKRAATKRDMLFVTSATLALINFIGIIDGKY